MLVLGLVKLPAGMGHATDQSYAFISGGELDIGVIGIALQQTLITFEEGGHVLVSPGGTPAIIHVACRTGITAEVTLPGFLFTVIGVAIFDGRFIGL